MKLEREREREKVLFTVNLWIKVNEQLGLKKKWLPITHTIHTGCDKNTKWSDDDCGYLFSKWNINKGSYYCLDSVYLQGFVTVILQLVVGLAHVNREGSYQVSLMNPYIVVRCCVCMPYISQLWSLGRSPTLIQCSTVQGTRIVIHNSISLWNKMCVIFIRRYFWCW